MEVKAHKAWKHGAVATPVFPLQRGLALPRQQPARLQALKYCGKLLSGDSILQNLARDTIKQD